jgi:hypothetical protein
MRWDVAGLRADMDRLAVRTWRKIECSVERGMSFAETSLTDENLLELAIKHPALRVHKFASGDEADSGADWEWWIGSDQTGWLCLRVQAKRVYGHEYKELTKGGRAPARFQYDTLIGCCDPERGVYPLHVFYNGWSRGALGSAGAYWPTGANWRACPQGFGPRTCRHARPRHYGCAVASSLAVKVVHDAPSSGTGRAVRDHLSNSLPWSYLLGYPPPGRPWVSKAWGGGDVERWMGRVHATVDLLSRPDPPGREQWVDLDPSAVDPGSRIAELPHHVEAVRGGWVSDLPAFERRAAPPVTIVLDAAHG